MFYLTCFCLAMLLLLILIAYGNTADINMVLLIISIAVGCGGYYALSLSENLREALLANRIVYVTGAFAPMILLLIICNICRVDVPVFLRVGMFTLQIFIFACACTMGYLDIFYRDVTYCVGANGVYLTKTYGSAHILHLTMLLIYTLAGVVTGLYSLNRKSVVSRINVYTLLFVDVIVVGVYIVERVARLDYEVLPACYALAAYIYMIPLAKINLYSIYSNQSILEEKIKNIGFIYFSRSLRYMGCSEHAAELFPELSQWELEKKIPGNGGRFNTFL